MPSHDLLPSSDVAVVTVSYGSDDVIGPFLDSVEADAETVAVVIVVDNRPSPDSAVERILRDRSAVYIAAPDNVGYGAGINLAVRTLPTSVRWILISNPDVVLERGAVNALREAGEESDTIGAIGPAILDLGGAVYPSARAVPSLRTGLGHALFASMWTDNPWTRAYHADYLAQPRDAGWLSGACLMVRRAAFDQVGGFDEGYFMYFEDVDLGVRLARAGFQNLYAPQAVVRHSGGHSTLLDRTTVAMSKAHHRSALRFLARRYPGPLLLPLRIALRIGLALRSAWTTRDRRRSAA
jgi:N-acetylglucosaminyl-diphospho-decaprenol L-rhamnosyltransferase